MSDLIKYLRRAVPPLNRAGKCDTADDYTKAADEIERQAKRIAKLEEQAAIARWRNNGAFLDKPEVK